MPEETKPEETKEEPEKDEDTSEFKDTTEPGTIEQM